MTEKLSKVTLTYETEFAILRVFESVRKNIYVK